MDSCAASANARIALCVVRAVEVAEEVEDQSEPLAVAVDEDRPVIGVGLQHRVAAPEHAPEHRVLDLC
eukprot:CAMPEP_0184244118 /NCGR_PEP_ID=MMETSP0977-20130417/687_1 /TAXON_ID=483370 /ORGANISM="non described non described, Strain CCMP2097" /LENGTH=67 /DNA_ID=CAMNT_0026549401 /DNA_START=30 /DNA_END=229 /DNA_ORIENTATION=+